MCWSKLFKWGQHTHSAVLHAWQPSILWCASLITFLLWSRLSCQFRKRALSRTFPVLPAAKFDAPAICSWIYILGVRQWRHGAFCVSRQHRLCRRWPRFWCVYSSSVKQSLLSVNHEQFPMQIFHRNSSGTRTPTSNLAWTTKEKTSTRNRGAERTSPSTAKATPPTRDRGTGDWNQRHYDRFTVWKTPTS